MSPEERMLATMGRGLQDLFMVGPSVPSTNGTDRSGSSMAALRSIMPGLMNGAIDPQSMLQSMILNTMSNNGSSGFNLDLFSSFTPDQQQQLMMAASSLNSSSSLSSSSSSVSPSPSVSMNVSPRLNGSRPSVSSNHHHPSVTQSSSSSSSQPMAKPATSQPLKPHRSPNTKSTKSKSDRKRYLCPKCPYATDRRDLFSRHENIHRDEKPFRCYLCNKMFNRADHVKKHFLRIHKGANYDVKLTKRVKGVDYGPEGGENAPCTLNQHPGIQLSLSLQNMLRSANLGQEQIQQLAQQSPNLFNPQLINRLLELAQPSESPSPPLSHSGSESMKDPLNLSYGKLHKKEVLPKGVVEAAAAVIIRQGVQTSPMSCAVAPITLSGVMGGTPDLKSLSLQDLASLAARSLHHSTGGLYHQEEDEEEEDMDGYDEDAMGEGDEGEDDGDRDGDVDREGGEGDEEEEEKKKWEEMELEQVDATKEHDDEPVEEKGMHHTRRRRDRNGEERMLRPQMGDPSFPVSPLTLPLPMSISCFTNSAPSCGTKRGPNASQNENHEPDGGNGKAGGDEDGALNLAGRNKRKVREEIAKSELRSLKKAPSLDHHDAPNEDSSDGRGLIPSSSSSLSTLDLCLNRLKKASSSPSSSSRSLSSSPSCLSHKKEEPEEEANDQEVSTILSGSFDPKSIYKHFFLADGSLKCSLCLFQPKDESAIMKHAIQMHPTWLHPQPSTSPSSSSPHSPVDANSLSNRRKQSQPRKIVA